jgi:hypothetical protein
MKHRATRLWQAGSCLLCAVVASQKLNTLGPSEFRGGRVTGPLFTLAETATYLFVLGFLVSFVRPRIAAAVTLTASLLCWPLYLYMTTPGLFRRVFGGEYSVPLKTSLVWDWWSIAGMLSLSFAGYLCLREFRAARSRVE